MKKLISCLIALFLFVGLTSSVYADNGSLVIDNSPINNASQSSSKQNSIGSQVAPYLFLEGTQRQQAKINETAQQQLKTAQQQDFKKSEKKKSTTTSIAPVSSHLFSKSYTIISVASGSNASQITPSSKAPIWLFYVMSGIALLAAVSVGIFLGRRYSKIFRKTNKSKERGSLNV